MAQETLTPAQFKDLKRIAYDRWGLEIPPDKQTLINNRISKLMRKQGHSSVDALLELASRPGEEMLDLFDVLSTNYTSFFREAGHFDCLIEELERTLPARPGGGPPKLRFWSAACSNGCEPYTLSMVLNDRLPVELRGDMRILATDLSESVLMHARRGVYSKKTVEGMPAGCLERHFKPQGDGYAVQRHIRDALTFGAVNLNGPWKMSGPFDAIFCRNVMIYFDAPTRNRLVERLRKLLRPQGLLFVGSSESLFGKNHGLEFVGPGSYRNVGTHAG